MAVVPHGAVEPAQRHINLRHASGWHHRAELASVSALDHGR